MSPWFYGLDAKAAWSQISIGDKEKYFWFVRKNALGVGGWGAGLSDPPIVSCIVQPCFVVAAYYDDIMLLSVVVSQMTPLGKPWARRLHSAHTLRHLKPNSLARRRL